MCHIHAHKHRLPQRSRFGDLRSLWYVVIDEAIETVILKYWPGFICSFFLSFFNFILYNVSNYNTASKTPTVLFLSLPNEDIFHIFTFTVYHIGRHVTYILLTRLSLESEFQCHFLHVNRSIDLFLITPQKNGAKVNILNIHTSPFFVACQATLQ